LLERETRGMTGRPRLTEGVSGESPPGQSPAGGRTGHQAVTKWGPAEEEWGENVTGSGERCLEY